eukprot:TRINITY_DN10146_c0_g2_i1.p1 TRINITY_DN10146_c0_g2~~TRINITY_DN10146_c0_g2_i1.p1  ORF type:complete len:380 (+),score=70.79 TRINITY_DN10146_c0_g2_i1:121-1260(+)
MLDNTSIFSVKDAKKLNLCFTDILKNYEDGQLREVSKRSINDMICSTYKLEADFKVFLFTVTTCPLSNKEAIDKIVNDCKAAHQRADRLSNFAKPINSRKVNVEELQIFALETLYEHSHEDLISVLSEESSKKKLEAMRKVIRPLLELERKNLWHGNIAPEKIFLKGGELKIVNTATPTACTKATIKASITNDMMPYYPLNLLLGKEKASIKVDVYSWGVTLYRLLFPEAKCEKMIERVSSMRYGNNDEFNRKVTEVLLKVLSEDSEERPNFEELKKMTKSLANYRKETGTAEKLKSAGKVLLMYIASEAEELKSQEEIKDNKISQLEKEIEALRTQMRKQKGSVWLKVCIEEFEEKLMAKDDEIKKYEEGKRGDILRS